MFGELISSEGEAPIALNKKVMTVGRRDSNDIVLNYPNVSGHHCQLELEEGYWYVSDMDSANGTKVNGRKVQREVVLPGDVIRFAKHEYTIQYSPEKNGAKNPPPKSEAKSGGIMGKIFGTSLLERAGLTGKKMKEVREVRRDLEGLSVRYDLDHDDDEDDTRSDKNKVL